MITLLGAILGFLGSLVPEGVRLFQEAQDKKHELTIMDRQLAQQQARKSERLEEIQLQNNAAQMQALYGTYATKIRWVDALNGTVRPVLAYGFFLLYAGVKWLQYCLYDAALQPVLLWTEEDQAIFAAIISFYYGQRALGKLRR